MCICICVLDFRGHRPTLGIISQDPSTCLLKQGVSWTRNSVTNLSQQALGLSLPPCMLPCLTFLLGIKRRHACLPSKSFINWDFLQSLVCLFGTHAYYVVLVGLVHSVELSQFFCLSLCNTGITDVDHHAQLRHDFRANKVASVTLFVLYLRLIERWNENWLHRVVPWHPPRAIGHVPHTSYTYLYA